MSYTFLKNENKGIREQTSFVGDKLEIFIPAYFFESSSDKSRLATIIGDRIESIGLFWFKTENKYYEFQLPLKIQFEFSQETKKELKLTPEMPSAEYVIYTLKHGDAFIYDTNHIKSADDINFFISKMIESAKLPPTIAYSDVLDIFGKALSATGIYGKLGVSMVSYEFMLSQLYRNRSNLSEAYREAYKPNKEYNYKMIRITKVPEYNSSFASFMGEDTTHQLASMVLRNKEHKEEIESPIEKIIKI